ncbi:MAG: SDR family NAD(P)-dependent oxidoreductase [Muribaculaceae bacterium]|nr:SDR family NAD(P)-dependent oxidoreductase [Muribaculaceae bacterium]
MVKIIIVGASSGIGKKVAEAFASRGIKVGLAARHTANLKKLKEQYPDNVEYASIDVTHINAPKLLNELIEKTGGMDIYFHVAGIGYDNPELDPQREAEIINTNAVGFARMIASAYNYFKASGCPGRIAAVTSVAGTNGIGKLSAYSASKRCAQTYLVALEQLAHNQGVDVKFTDIRPGWIRTPLLKSDRSYPLEMTLDQAVPLIIKAIVRHPRVAYIDWRWSLVTALWKSIPNALWTRLNLPMSSPKKQ